MTMTMATAQRATVRWDMMIMTMATGDNVNDVDGNGAMGNKVKNMTMMMVMTGNDIDDDGDGMTGDDNDDNDDGDEDNKDDGNSAMGSGTIGYDGNFDGDGR